MGKIALLLLLISGQAQAWDVVELQNVSIEYKKYLPGARFPLITSNGLSPRQLSDGLSIRVDTNFFKYLYWNNFVHSTTDSTNGGAGQFRALGYEFSFGFRPFSVIEIEYYHHSQHLLDAVGKYSYPLEDAVQLKLILFKEGQKNGLFD